MNPICVLCESIADTSEHIFAKCLFNKPYPQNMLTIPSCHQCNNSFSMDEEYVMYLIDYLKSIELQDGEFTREKAKNAFTHSDRLEDRMMCSLKADAGASKRVYFQVESSRVVRVLKKIAIGLFSCRYQKQYAFEELDVSFAFLSQMATKTKLLVNELPYTVLQEGTVKYTCSDSEIDICLGEFLYAAICTKHPI